MRNLFLVLCFFVCQQTLCQNSKSDNKIPILIRCDDIGMCHSVNMAAEQVLKTGIPVSMSVMVPCPWFSEAVEMLKKYPNVSVGIHLTLNSEWKQYRWGPVAGAKAVPSLVDSVGNFFPSRALLFANNPKLDEIETELRAQIEKALHSGLKIDYLDHHMSAAVQTPETRAILEKLAKEYKLAISRYYDENYVEGWYFATPDHKLDSMMLKLQTAQTDRINLFVIHIGLNSQEMNALEDLNPFGPKEMSKHRNGELNALVSTKFQKLLHDGKYRLVNYQMVTKERGLDAMKRPPGN
jgi:predicted glycoside hydrolase/deacetylase ChbG (UPF0249 family)